MNTEFVLINAEGKEVDWIDPVASFEETETHWIVDNTYTTYEISKNLHPGCTAEVRPQYREMTFQDYGQE